MLPNTKKFKTEKFAVIEVDIDQPTRYSYPHLDYDELKRKSGIVDSEMEEDDEVVKIAKIFEEKYGGQCGPNKKKKFKFRKDDFMDKGAGYVKDDFIDDSEAHDEYFPSWMETEKIGFYVNEGPLEFRQVIDLSNSPTTSGSKPTTSDPKAKPGPKPRSIAERDERMVGMSPLMRKTNKKKSTSKLAQVNERISTKEVDGKTPKSSENKPFETNDEKSTRKRKKLETPKNDIPAGSNGTEVLTKNHKEAGKLETKTRRKSTEKMRKEKLEKMENVVESEIGSKANVSEPELKKDKLSTSVGDLLDQLLGSLPSAPVESQEVATVLGRKISRRLMDWN